MKRIDRSNTFLSFSKMLFPVCEINTGEKIIIETNDALNEQVKKTSDINRVDWDILNPVTGPVYINEAEPGDTLVVNIEDISLADRGIMDAIPGAGLIGDRVSQLEAKIIPITEGRAHFSRSLIFDVKPMIGTIGVAPETEEISTLVPGTHGGNLDCALVKPGSRIYLPIYSRGALLGIGDLHAIMGDGEVFVCGLETAGEVTISVEILKDKPFPLPFVETDDLVAAVFSSETADDAARGAVRAMSSFLTGTVGLPLNEAGMLMSSMGNLRFCQMVNPLKTIRMEFPKSLLFDIGFTINKK